MKQHDIMTYRSWSIAGLLVLMTLLGCQSQIEGHTDAEQHSDTASEGDADTSEATDAASNDAADATDVMADSQQTGDADARDADGEADGDAADAAGSDGTDATDSGDSVDTCPSGEHDGGDGQCVPDDSCSQGYELDSHGACVLDDGCPVAYERDSSRRCVSIDRNVPLIDAFTGPDLKFYYSESSRGYLSFWSDTRFFISKTRVDSSTWISTNEAISDCQSNRRSSVWIDEGQARMVVCHFTTVRAFDIDGTKLWDENIGNFNYKRPVAVSIDAESGHGYLISGTNLRRINLSDGSVLKNITVEGQGMVHIDGNRAYLNGNGWVSGVNLALDTQEWKVVLDDGSEPPLCASGAVTADGDFITFCHDTLARFTPDGTIEWQRSIPPLPAPGRQVGRVAVLTGEGDVVIATGQPSIAAYDADTGRISWVRELPGHAGPLVAGDSGNLYAYAASIGRVYVLNSATGDARRIYDGVVGGWDSLGVYDLALRDGLLYVARGDLSVVDVESQDYDPDSNWPTAAHDNQRTGHTASSLDY